MEIPLLKIIGNIIDFGCRFGPMLARLIWLIAAQFYCNFFLLKNVKRIRSTTDNFKDGKFRIFDSSTW